MGGGLHAITYVSTATAPFSDTELEALLTSSRATNLARDLTGMLLYRDGRFLQVLEGPEDDVREIIERIGNDPRHRDMRIVSSDPIAGRRFAEWTMGYEPIAAPASAPPEGFRDSFDDLDAHDAALTARALVELTVWFHARSAPVSGDPVDAARS
ncbi:BLUF domain-containing protein [Microbacterium trichothecenolyticum]|uniref:BLUF domain-containing protein n=1 Tax=Microbacterium trichothecenolyticum TaxID=69370 RepID=A0ABU0TUZ6_MICTR|nr:BLUF domain-containing protein [Microbacterium trichothecenolyticum]MDQ1123483.1 hypothetical protein [Microbacterium trichothecenolyticum]